jgi:uncharacterized protein
MIGPQTCPICEKALEPEADSFPFCSPRCTQIDLLRWSKGEYAIARELDPREAEILKAIEEGDIPPEMLD